jgi:hypothetical protein
VPKWAVMAALILVEPPGFRDVLGLGEQDELVYIQTLVSQPPCGGFFLQLPAVALPSLRVASHRRTEVFARLSMTLSWLMSRRRVGCV